MLVIVSNGENRCEKDWLLLLETIHYKPIQGIRSEHLFIIIFKINIKLIINFILQIIAFTILLFLKYAINKPTYVATQVAN